MNTTVAALPVIYFDGKSTRAQPVELRMEGEFLHVRSAELAFDVPVAQVIWPERTRHGRRCAELPSGATLQCADGAAWDHWCRANGLHESAVVRFQQSWRWVTGFVLAFFVLMVGLYNWGLPALARGIVAITPQSFDEKMGQTTLSAIDDALMGPSGLALAQQEGIRNAFTRALRAQAPGQVPTWNLKFRKSRLGPNALALPGGTLLMTDEMVQLVDGDTDVLTAVLAHELGHVKHRHALAMLVQVSALGAVTSLVLGDFSSLLAALPALLGQAHYSREAEREADSNAVQVLTQAGMDPRVMVTMFDRLAALRELESKETSGGNAEKPAAAIGNWLGLAFASHPADAERIALFRRNSH